MTPAPIALFTYNRPEHTRQTLEALKKNSLAKASHLFIFSDGPKSPLDEELVKEVRNHIRNIDGFKEITTIERDENRGLASSITDGVTRLVDECGRVIVLEDDMITSPAFLTFMNSALEYFKLKKRVWHISGWNYPIDPTGLPDTFLWRVMNCWGWATWADRWQFYEKDTKTLINNFTKQDIYRFNLDGCEDFWGQVLANRSGAINTWAIYWYATIFLNQGLCLNPAWSYVKNIGLDGSGIHCGNDPSLNRRRLNTKTHVRFPKKLEEDKEALKAIKKYFSSRKRPLLTRIVNKLSKTLTQRVRPR